MASSITQPLPGSKPEHPYLQDWLKNSNMQCQSQTVVFSPANDAKKLRDQLLAAVQTNFKDQISVRQKIYALEVLDAYCLKLVEHFKTKGSHHEEAIIAGIIETIKDKLDGAIICIALKWDRNDIQVTFPHAHDWQREAEVLWQIDYCLPMHCRHDNTVLLAEVCWRHLYGDKPNEWFSLVDIVTDQFLYSYSACLKDFFDACLAYRSLNDNDPQKRAIYGNQALFSCAIVLTVYALYDATFPGSGGNDTCLVQGFADLSKVTPAEVCLMSHVLLLKFE